MSCSCRLQYYFWNSSVFWRFLISHTIFDKLLQDSLQVFFPSISYLLLKMNWIFPFSLIHSENQLGSLDGLQHYEVEVWAQFHISFCLVYCFSQIISFLLIKVFPLWRITFHSKGFQIFSLYKTFEVWLFLPFTLSALFAWSGYIFCKEVCLSFFSSLPGLLQDLPGLLQDMTTQFCSYLFCILQVFLFLNLELNGVGFHSLFIHSERRSVGWVIS